MDRGSPRSGLDLVEFGDMTDDQDHLFVHVYHNRYLLLRDGWDRVEEDMINVLKEVIWKG